MTRLALLGRAIGQLIDDCAALIAVVTLIWFAWSGVPYIIGSIAHG